MYWNTTLLTTGMQKAICLLWAKSSCSQISPRTVGLYHRAWHSITLHYTVITLKHADSLTTFTSNHFWVQEQTEPSPFSLRPENIGKKTELSLCFRLIGGDRTSRLLLCPLPLPINGSTKRERRWTVQVMKWLKLEERIMGHNYYGEIAAEFYCMGY